MPLDNAIKDSLAAKVKEVLAPLFASNGRRSTGAPILDPAKKGQIELSLTRYLRGISRGNWYGADKELAAYEAAQKEDAQKTMSEQIGHHGGFLVPMVLQAGIIEMLTARAVMRRMGCTVISNLATNSIEFNTITKGVIAEWIGESDDKPEDDPEFGRIELVLKELAVLVPIPNNLMEDSTPAADMIVKKEMARSISLVEDLGFIMGTGGQMPLGLYHWPGITHTNLAGAIVANDLLDMMSRIECNNGLYNSWLMHPRSKNTLRQLVDLNGRYIWTQGWEGASLSNITQREPDKLLGMPVFYTTQIPVNLNVAGFGNESFIALGNWEDMWIIDKHAGLTMDVSEHVYFTTDRTLFRATKRTTCGFKYEENFEILEGVL